jgi:hypothetical protein
MSDELDVVVRVRVKREWLAPTDDAGVVVWTMKPGIAREVASLLQAAADGTLVPGRYDVRGEG